MNPVLEFFQAAVPASAPKASRVLGSSFSPSSWRLHAQADNEFRAELQKAKRHKKPAPAWASVCTEEVPGVAPSELAKFKAAVVDGLRQHLDLAERNESVVATLPADPPCHAGVEAFTIGAEDSRSMLHGQRGLRASTCLAEWTVVGVLRCKVKTQEELDEELEGEEEQGAASRARELAVQSFCHAFYAQDTLLYASAYGHGNAVSLINDGAIVDLRTGSARHGRPNNVALVEVRVHGWPYQVAITTRCCDQGEELLMDYSARSPGFWGRYRLYYDQARAANQAQGGDVESMLPQAPSCSVSGLADGARSGLGPIPNAAACYAAAPRSPSDSASLLKADVDSESEDSEAPPLPSDFAQRAWSLVNSNALGLLKLGVSKCPVIARAALSPAIDATSLGWSLLTLNMTGMAARPEFAKVLHQEMEPLAMVVLPAPQATAEQRSSFAGVVATLGKRDVVASCVDAATGGRAAYLLPPGELARAQMARWPLPLPADVSTSSGFLCLVLMLPTAPAPVVVPRSIAAAPAPAPVRPAQTLPPKNEPAELPAKAAAPTRGRTRSRSRSSERKRRHQHKRRRSRSGREHGRSKKRFGRSHSRSSRSSRSRSGSRLPVGHRSGRPRRSNRSRSPARSRPEERARGWGPPPPRGWEAPAPRCPLPPGPPAPQPSAHGLAPGPRVPDEVLMSRLRSILESFGGQCILAKVVDLMRPLPPSIDSDCKRCRRFVVSLVKSFPETFSIGEWPSSLVRLVQPPGATHPARPLPSHPDGNYGGTAVPDEVAALGSRLRSTLESFGGHCHLWVATDELRPFLPGSLPLGDGAKCRGFVVNLVKFHFPHLFSIDDVPSSMVRLRDLGAQRWPALVAPEHQVPPPPPPPPLAAGSLRAFAPRDPRQAARQQP